MKGGALNNYNSMDANVSIEWPEANQQRIRKVVSRSNHRVTGKYPSLKMGRMMHWESTLERDAFMFMDINGLIKEFHEQPAKIIYCLDGEKHAHFPDILATTLEGLCFIEIKEEKDASKCEVRARTQLLSEQLPLRGYSYLVLTEQEIRRAPRLDNVRRLLRYGRIKPDIQTIERIKREYFSSDECLLGDITLSENCNSDYPTLCRMIIDGMLTTDINQIWNDQTPIALNHKFGVQS